MGKRLQPWSEEDRERVVGILTSFNGADEVCAMMHVDAEELDRRCYQSFGESFADLMERCHVTGRAMLRQALYESAMSGNAKALDTLSREQLGTGPVETRRRVAGIAASKQQEEVDF